MVWVRLENHEQDLSALRELAGDPRTAQHSERVYDFSIRWGTTLSGRLQRLNYFSARGGLAEDELRRYEQLTNELREAVPLVDRLGLARPRTS